MIRGQRQIYERNRRQEPKETETERPVSNGKGRSEGRCLKMIWFPGRGKKRREWRRTKNKKGTISESWQWNYIIIIINDVYSL